MKAIIICLPVLTLVGALSLPAGAAKASDYGADTCKNGYVWRETTPNDHVCVTPEQRRQARSDNFNAGERRAGGGAYGADTCQVGFVWRESTPSDHVCVTPEERTRARRDNASSEGRFKY